MSTIVRDMEINDIFVLDENTYGRLVGKKIVSKGGSGFQEPDYILKFQLLMNPYIDIIHTSVSWDKKYFYYREDYETSNCGDCTDNFIHLF
jgi:hypothetical protein